MARNITDAGERDLLANVVRFLFAAFVVPYRNGDKGNDGVLAGRDELTV